MNEAFSRNARRGWTYRRTDGTEFIEDLCRLCRRSNKQPICFYGKDPYEAKYQYLINKREKVGLDHYDGPKAFMEYSNDTKDIYKNIEYYNSRKNCKVLKVFDDMIADMINNKTLNPIVTELFI